MPIYALAAADADEMSARYWFISSRGEFKRVDYHENGATADASRRLCGRSCDAIRRGAFPAVPGDEDDFYNSFENCRYCDFTRICSRRRVYESQAKQDDEDILAWFEVAERRADDQQP